MLQSNGKEGVEAAAWLMGYLATDPANGRPLVAMGAAPALVCLRRSFLTATHWSLLLAGMPGEDVPSAGCVKVFHCSSEAKF